MDYIDNPDLSIGSEGSDQPMQSGGFFWKSCGRTKNDEKVLEFARKSRFDDVAFMIQEDLVDNYCSQDEDGSTILHHLTRNRNVHGANNKSIQIVLNQPNIKSFINVQDKNGDTPLHAAVKGGHMDLADLYIKMGANKSIKNNNGNFVDSDVQCPNDNLMPTKSSTNNKKTITVNNADQFDAVMKILVNGFVNNQPLSEETATLGKFPQLNNETQTASKVDSQKTNLNATDTDEFLNELLKADKDAKETIKQAGGYVSPNTDELQDAALNTYAQDTSGANDDFINRVFNIGRKQHGGKRSKRRVVTRTLPSSNYNEFDSENDPQRQLERDSSSELQRMINNRATEIHERVVKKIMDLLSIDESTAKLYKAWLWRLAKKEHPELTTNYDKSIEMEKMVTKKTLSKIDIDKVQKELDKEREERNKEREERDNKEAKTTDKKKDVKKKDVKKKKSTKKVETPAPLEAGLYSTPSDYNF